MGSSVEAIVEGGRPLHAFTPEAARGLGEEAQDLAALVAQGVPVLPGVIVRRGVADPAATLSRAVRRGLADAERVHLRALLPTPAAAARLDRRVGVHAWVDDPGEAEARVRELLDAVDGVAALGALGAMGELHVRVVLGDAGPVGWAASVDPVDGDPDLLGVRVSGAGARWRLDRRTMRVLERGDGPIDDSMVARVADLADRAQLAVGRPVEVEWATHGERPGVLSVRPLPFRSRFARGGFRRVALVRADEGTVAPLTLDAVAAAVGRDDVEPDVRRIYARPYQRVVADPVGELVEEPATTLARAVTRAGRLASDVAAPLSAARAFERGLATRLAELDALELSTLGDAELLESLREREALVAEALGLLDRSRSATGAVLAALEATVGALPAECEPALSAARIRRSRRKVRERLERLAADVRDHHGRLPDDLPPALRTRWDEAREDLREVRPLGLDLSPVAIGRDDESLRSAIERAADGDHRAIERTRRDAIRRLRATARARPLGWARENVTTSLVLLAGRLATSRGRLAEGLASAQLRLRRAASEAGRRLTEAAVLDRPGDALYLYRAEIEDALGNEPGAYAARVRLRREDDERWRCFAAPALIEGRVPGGG